ncbi:MAG: TetR/AcrR family transcriptional regulator [Agathobacter sp.]|nr:TetR/AcrR family transcriptional regulator [Agathobacter sp.]
MGYNKRNDEINTLTKESIAMAYYELLQHKNNITVSTICESAGVSRNAYYRNFTSTDDIIIYSLILKWSKYCEANPLPPDNNEAVKEQLIRFFYAEKEYIRAIKRHEKVYLIEELFRKVIIPEEDIGMAKYLLYVVAYAVYGMIRAMVDNDFAETPEQILLSITH